MEDLFGRDEGKLNAQGRLSIPSKHRRLLPEQLVVAKSPDKEHPALVLYTREDFKAWFDEVLESKGGSKANSAAQFHLRIEFYGDSEVVDFDGNGRILLPPFLRDYAGISSSVVIIGMGSNLLLCTPEAWEAHQREFASNRVFDDETSVGVI